MPEATMTLNLREPEMAALDRLAASKGLSKTAVMRQALRLYELVDDRLCAGSRLLVRSPSGDVTELAPIGPGLGVVE